MIGPVTTPAGLLPKGISSSGGRPRCPAARLHPDTPRPRRSSRSSVGVGWFTSNGTDRRRSAGRARLPLDVEHHPRRVEQRCSLGSAVNHSGTGYEPTVVVRRRGAALTRSACVSDTAFWYFVLGSWSGPGAGAWSVAVLGAWSVPGVVLGMPWELVVVSKSPKHQEPAPPSIKDKEPRTSLPTKNQAPGPKDQLR